MKKLLEYLAKSIVTKPDSVEVTEEKSEGDVLLLKLKVDPEDMGLVIGKGGKIIRAIRNLIRIKAIREGARINVELVEVPGYEKKEPSPDTEPEMKKTTPEKEPDTAPEPAGAPEEPEVEKPEKEDKGSEKKSEKTKPETSSEPGD